VSIHPQHERPALTPRQIALLELLVAGHGKGKIAERLRIGERSVDRLIAGTAARLSAIDPRLDEEQLGTVGRTARIVALYLALYPRRREEPEQLRPTAEAASPPLLVRLTVRSELDIALDGIRNDTQVTVQSLEDAVTHTAHGIIIDDLGPQADVRPQSLEVWSHSTSVTVSHRMVVEDPKRPLFQVLFDPPLTRGQRLTYHYAVVTANYFPMTKEELDRRIAAGQYHLTAPFCEKAYNVGSPTGHLYLRLTFPPLFEIEDEHVVVQVGRGGPRDQAEEDRIRGSAAFGKSLFARRASLTLDVDKPPTAVPVLRALAAQRLKSSQHANQFAPRRLRRRTSRWPA